MFRKIVKINFFLRYKQEDLPFTFECLGGEVFNIELKVDFV